MTINCCKKLQGSFWRKHTVALSEAIPAEPRERGELLELLEALPEKYRAVVHLCYYEGIRPRRLRPFWGAIQPLSAASWPGGGLCCGTFGKERKTYDGTGLSEAF